MKATRIIEPARGTVGHAVRDLEKRLRSVGREDAAPTSRHAMAAILDCSFLDLHFRDKDLLSPDSARRYRQWSVRLEAHEPLAYVTGCTEFRGHAIHVNNAVLVPRPETEELVQRVLDCTSLWDAPRVTVVDAGTGSGCIAVSLALEAPAADVLAIDSSEQALQVARRNVLYHDLAARVTLRKGHWLQGIGESSWAAVVANPPYVTESEWAGLAPTVRDHEPRAALLGGPDGLSAYRRLVPEAFRALRPGGWFFLEIGASQARQVEALVAVAGFSGLVSLRDLQGLHRIVAAQKP